MPFVRSAAGTSLTATAFAKAPFSWLTIEKLPLLGLSVASTIITLMAHEGLRMEEARYGLPLGYRIENAFVSYGRYLDKALWPHDLSVLYLHPGAWPGGRVVVAASVVILVSGYAIGHLRRRPYLFVGWFWFLGVLVPAIGLRQVGVQAMADRFAYLPLIGLFIMIVWGVADLTLRWPHRRFVLATAAGIVLTGLCACSVLQLRHWQDSFTLFRHAIEVDPNNYVAHGNLSAAYSAIGQFDKAREHAEQAVRIKPAFMEARLQLGLLAVFEEKPHDARLQYRNAIQNRPDALPVIRRIGESLVRDRHWSAAALHYELYLELAPDDLAARAERAMVLASAQRPVEATAEYRAILGRKPDWPEVLNNLAWLRATYPQPEGRDAAEAIRLAERACELTQRQQAVYLGTLAAAYAEAGRFADAIKTAQAARELARANGQTEIAKTNEKLLELYRANKPYRQEKL
jgi:protein O-mannosyl-transferase